MIAIQSTRDLRMSPRHTGKITMTMDLIQNIPGERAYEIRIIDKCTKVIQKEFSVIEDGKETGETEIIDTEIVLGSPIIRQTRITYDEIDKLAENLRVDVLNGSLTDNINELFRQGILNVTIQEIHNGEGMYFSDNIQDWEIVR